MVDLILNVIRKLVEVAVVVVIIVGLFNFVRTPGNLVQKLKGSYERTVNQGGEVANAGRDLFSSQSDQMVQNVGRGIMKINKNREAGQLMELGRSGLGGKE